MTDPVALDEAKAFLRVTHDAEDGLIGTLLEAATAVVQEEAGTVLTPLSPAPLRVAVLLLVAHAFDGREPPALDVWLKPYRQVRL